MKIIEKKTCKYVNFRELEVGDVFKFTSEYHLKIENIKVNGEYYINAISLNTGESSLFCEDINVEPVNATLVIDDNEDEREEENENN